MSTRTLRLPLLCAALVAAAASPALAARTTPKGRIVTQAVAERARLDPNLDNFVSKTTAGFVSNDQTESEVGYIALPQFAVEPTGDLQTGSNGGPTDLVDTATYQSSFVSFHKGADGVADTADDRLLFRLRIGDKSNGAFGYSVLIDTDLKFGFTGASADPNAVSNNAGFEAEIIVGTGGGNNGINVSNVDGRTNGVVSSTYTLADNSQWSVALTENSNDDDFFFDFAIPLSALAPFGITSTTPLRMATATSSSPSSALGGSASDIGGVKDNDPVFGNDDDRFIVNVENSPPVTIGGLGPGGSFGRCGDGFKAATEACDDGNDVGGDGCSATCAAIEANFCCIGAGTRCVAAGTAPAGTCQVCAPATSNTTWSPASAGSVCRAATGTCDVAEVCNGTATTCGADTLRPLNFVCRASAGTCDVTEVCSGTSGACGSDAFRPSTVTCRGSAGTCDVAERCTGSAAACPGDSFLAATVMCRASAGACDVAEQCTGAAAACPGDSFQAATVTCRASAGACDVAEQCTGAAAACPGDAFQPATVTCRASAGVCDAAEQCTGAAAACPNDAFQPATVTCRAAAGACDVAERCTGSGIACPADALASNGTSCNDGDSCTSADVCTAGLCGGTPGPSCVASPVITTPEPTAPVNDATPTIAGSGPPSRPISVLVDGVLVGTTTTNAAGEWTFTFDTPLEDGPASVTATATVGGVTSSPSAPWEVTIDTKPPETTLTSGPAASSPDDTPTFAFTADEAGSTFACRIDAGAFVPCASALTSASLADGAHTFEVRATDPAGNGDPTPASLTFSIDRAAPDTTIVEAPPALVASSSAAFVFTSGDPTDTFECSLDGAAYVACPADLTLTGLSDGPHTLAVRAVDANGNTDPSPATGSFTVDTTPPDTFVDQAPGAVITTPEATLVFSSDNQDASFECGIDGGAFAPCNTTLALTDLEDGLHTVAVRARDEAGNVDPSPAEASFRVDTTAPETTVDEAPGTLVAADEVSFSFGSPDRTATFECSVDGGAFTACPAEYTLTGLTDGSHTVSVRAVDENGNRDPSPVTTTFTVDTTAPDTRIDAGPADPTGATEASFTLASDETGATYECSLDGGAFAACPADVVFEALALGAHTLSVRATDAAGNVDATPATWSWEVVTDTDGDGLPDEDEVGTDPEDGDSDDDGVLDGDEPRPGEDTDGDGLVNARDPDSDNDGLADGTELGVTTPPADTDTDAGNFVPDADPTTTTNPLSADTDEGGVRDGAEDTNLDGKIDAGETDPNEPGDDTVVPDDTDGDGLTDVQEAELGTDPNDADTDDDGVRDGAEPNPSLDTDGDGLINARDADSDGDGLTDGLELGVTTAGTGTDTTKGVFVADTDPTTTTNPLLKDTDAGGVSDGDEDRDHDGAIDPGETDPNVGVDDVADPDIDRDTIPNEADGSGDTDGDGTANERDTDSDGDGLLDADEAGDADLATPAVDTDGDAAPDFLDTDSDNDGVPDGSDNCRLVVNGDQVDVDGDGTGDACDGDVDGDGAADEADNCPAMTNADQADPDGDGRGDPCDDDDDGDGFVDGIGISGGGCATGGVSSLALLALGAVFRRRRRALTA